MVTPATLIHRDADRALALALALPAVAYFMGVGALISPESALARATPAALRSVAARCFPQQWRLFGPDVPARDASVLYRCGGERSGGAWRDPEAAAIAAARTFRLLPENKAIHAPRAVAAALYQEWLARSASLCPEQATEGGSESCPSAVEAVRSSESFERAIELTSPTCKREGETRLALRLVIADRSAPDAPDATQTIEINLGERSWPP